MWCSCEIPVPNGDHCIHCNRPIHPTILEQIHNQDPDPDLVAYVALIVVAAVFMVAAAILYR